MFNRLELTDNQLYLDINVQNLEYWSDAKITAISIDTVDSYSEDTLRAYTYELRNKSDHFIGRLLPAEFSAGGDYPVSFGDIVYLTVHIEGTEKVCKPCGIKPEFNGIAVNWKCLCKQGLSLLPPLSSGCSNNKAFLDWTLHLKAFKLAVAFGDIPRANQYFKEWFSTKREHSKCKCGYV